MQWRQKLCVHPSRFARLFALTSGCWQILHVSAMVLDTQLIVAQQAFPLPVRVHGAGGRRHVCSLLHTCVRARVHASGTKPSGGKESREILSRPGFRALAPVHSAKSQRAWCCARPYAGWRPYAGLACVSCESNCEEDRPVPGVLQRPSLTTTGRKKQRGRERGKEGGAAPVRLAR